ncbi:hypothetical protein CPB83DRAFT_766783 [Crepidotus variabilis]|uniref:Uncharacterized protein n=1 Tax=Crepidotus variabilis TaxID=179855 RepID=A0A9P6JQ96_9AGAR|nr:hypothetical protein CPB83DRAFT_766783 [Crepidotus variabilis]
MSDALANFTCLDELTQVIYQSFYKFVVLSTVTDDKWNVHVGLAGREGRWWHGCWTEEDVHRIFGSRSSDKLLESFAEKLAEVFVQGELCISDWSTEKGANIKFTLGPTSKKPMHVPMVEMSAEDAAAHATSVFIDIALQAQSRKCKLYPSSSVEYSGVPSSSSRTVRPLGTTGPEPMEVDSSSKPKSSAGLSAKDIITRKNASQEQAKKSVNRRSGSPADASTVRPHKGASLANPNKKARKYQAIEFESDDE